MRRLGILAVAAALGLTAGANAAPASSVRTMGRIVIPAIGVNTLFFNGQSTAATDHGPAHYPWSAMPGEGRTVAIAGHRVTHTHPFLLLGRLKAGDEIAIHYGAAPSFARTACYRMTGSRVVSPSDASVTDDVGSDRLVLTTCTPPHFATYRLVVTARRVSSCR